MTEYNPITWQTGDFVTVSKQNQAQSNIQYLFDTQVEAKYQFSSVQKSQGIKILAGSIVLPPAPTTDHVRGTVYFNNFFTPGCFPIVNATPMINAGQRLSVVVSGIGRLEVTDTGFIATVCQFEKVNNFMKRSFRVNYIAVGY